MRGGLLICGILAAMLTMGCSSTERQAEAAPLPQAAKEEPPPAPPRQALARAGVDRILVEKQQRRMKLMRGNQVVREYQVALGRDPIGPKERIGDGRTPEGTYRIDIRNSQSAFYRSLRISYPDQGDRLRAAKRGVSPGGSIMIHGLPNGRGAVGRKHLQEDWTDGCIAVTNEEMDEIWQAVPLGAVIEIRA